MSLLSILAVAMGGAAGALLRALTGRLLQFDFPVATLIVNMAGCLFLGILTAHQSVLSEEIYALLSTGVCGALTTFSTFILETAILIRIRAFFSAFLNIVLTLGLALTAFTFGYFMEFGNL